MANRCQLCPDEPRVAVEDWRAIWLSDFYLEWGRCCNDKPFDEPLQFTNATTGEVKTITTPQELWEMIAGVNNKDQYGQICM